MLSNKKILKKIPHKHGARQLQLFCLQSIFGGRTLYLYMYMKREDFGPETFLAKFPLGRFSEPLYKAIFKYFSAINNPIHTKSLIC